MKNIVIAAGYATRMYPLTENFPKPLLPIVGTTILDLLIDDIDSLTDIDEHIVVTNHKFYNIFESWRENKKLRCPIRIIDDGTVTNESRLGAVNDLLLAINSLKEQDDLLVVAADNLLNFSLQDFVAAFYKIGTSMIMCHYEPSIEKLQRTGVIDVEPITEDCFSVKKMYEKPKEPTSQWAVPPFYIYAKKDIYLLENSVKNKCFTDAPGSLAKYVSENSKLSAWKMSGTRMDIGDLKTYELLKNETKIDFFKTKK